ALHGFGQQRVECPLVHLFGHKPYADEYGNENPNQGNCRQPKADDYALFNPNRNLPDQNRYAHHHQCEKDQVIQNTVAPRLPKRVRRHRPNASHRALTSTAFACARSASTRFMKNSSSVGLICTTESIRASAALSSSRCAYSSGSGNC